VGAVIAPVFELFFNNSKFSPNHSKTKHGVATKFENVDEI
jgi:hypothetical protein